MQSGTANLLTGTIAGGNGAPGGRFEGALYGPAGAELALAISFYDASGVPHAGVIRGRVL